MKFLRLSASLLTISVLLAACGGGGGGGTPIPNPPGGGGGGGGATPTPAPTSKPTPTPAPSGGPTPTPGPSSVPVDKNFALNAAEGPQVNGTVGWYTAGTTAQWSQQNGEPPVGAFGDTSAGASATNGFGPMDGMSCAQTAEPANPPTTYSVHSFVGIYYNGTEYAIPSGVAMNNPTEPIAPTKNAPQGHPNDYWEIEQSTCEYNVHTHDFSGLVHIEDVNYTQSTSTTSPLSYSPSLQSFLDLWGVSLTSAGLAVPGGTSLTGPVAVYTGVQGSDVGPHGGHLVDAYTQVPVTSLSSIPLAYHNTTWIVIGGIPKLPDGTVALPSVEWEVEY